MTATNPLTRTRELLDRLERDETCAALITGSGESSSKLSSELIHLLTHLRFPEPRARVHWERIVEHRRRLREQLGREVGLRVAVMDYFVNIDRELRDPKVIEMEAFARTERRAIADGLTGLYNKAYFQAALTRELTRGGRHGRAVSLLLLDLDDFKQINDTHGHLAGDAVLARVASVVRQSIRDVDIGARYGGEEFAVVLPDTPEAGAIRVGERIRHDVERDAGPLRVTLSGGIAAFPEDGASYDALVEHADRGLYRAKGDGKNRICVEARERRRSPRYPIERSVAVALDSGRATDGMTRNASREGILVRVPTPASIGARLSLRIADARATSPELAGSVTRVDDTDDGYDVAIGLAAPLTHGPLLALSG